MAAKPVEKRHLAGLPSIPGASAIIVRDRRAAAMIGPGMTGPGMTGPGMTGPTMKGARRDA